MTPARSENYRIPSKDVSVRLKPQLRELGRVMLGLGWKFYASGHGMRAVCPAGHCEIQFSSTPRVPDTDAKKVLKKLSNCTHESDPPPRRTIVKRLRKALGR